MRCASPRVVEDLVHARRDVDLARLRAAAGHARHLLDRLLQPLQERGGRDACLLHDARGDAAVLGEQRHRQVLRLDLLLAMALSERLRLAHRVLGLLGQAIHVHRSPSVSSARRPGGQGTP